MKARTAKRPGTSRARTSRARVERERGRRGPAGDRHLERERAERGAAGNRDRTRARTSPRELVARAARIRLVLLDVDGVLTDGRLWYGEGGEALKAFDVRDGHGIVMLRDRVDFGVISGRPGRTSEARLRDLRFKHLVFGERDKLGAYRRLAHLGVPDAEVAYMGDDVNDIPLLLEVGLSACPADAHPDVKEAVHLVTRAPGGRGAVRELCDLILRARGER